MSVLMPPNVNLILIGENWYFYDFVHSRISQGFGSRPIAITAWSRFEVRWDEVSELPSDLRDKIYKVDSSSSS